MTTLLLVVGIALLVSAFCSVLEAVLLSMSHSFVALLQERGERAGRLLAAMRENIDEPIAAILTLNTIAHTAGAAVGGALALEVFGDRWVALFSAVLTLAILVLSEIIPKTIGATYWQALARPAAYTLRGMIVVMKPVLLPLALFNRLITPRGPRPPTVSRAELEVLAEIGRREGTIDQEEWEVVSKVINLDQIAVGEVMTPRTRIVAVPIEASVAEAKDAMLEHGHLRMPVFEGSIDNVVGVLLARDLWRADRDGVREIRSIARSPWFVPVSKPVEDLIREMRGARVQFALVLDEFGGTAGLVTLEDMIEEIVGEIYDEHEQAQPAFQKTAGGAIRIGGDVSIRVANQHLGLDLPEEVYDTIGGYVFGSLGRVARVGDEVAHPLGRFRIAAMDGRRITEVIFFPAPAPDGDAASPPSAEPPSSAESEPPRGEGRVGTSARAA